MNTPRDIHGLVFKGGAAVLLARVVGLDGVPLLTPQVDSIRYTAATLDAADPDRQTPLAGHENVPLTVADVLFNTLAVGPLWSADSQGYNFRHTLDGGAASAFPVAGLSYQVRYEVTPTGGPLIVVRFQLKAI